MKKSAFNTPRGKPGGGRQEQGWTSSGSPARGYGRPINYEYYSPNRRHTGHNDNSGDDFIPFESSIPPSSDRKSGPNWQSPKLAGHWRAMGHRDRRYSVSSGYNNYNDNGGSANYQQAPYYKDGISSFRGHRKNFHRESLQGRFDISRYMNLHSFLEDPWAELTRKLSNNDDCDHSPNDTTALDFSFGSSVLDVVALNDSVDEENLTSTHFSSQEEIHDNFVEYEASIKSTSQESIVISLEASFDPKINWNMKN